MGDKTKLILYHRCKRKNVDIKMGSEEILKVNNFCYLGIKLQRMKKLQNNT